MKTVSDIHFEVGVVIEKRLKYNLVCSQGVVKEHGVLNLLRDVYP